MIRRRSVSARDLVKTAPAEALKLAQAQLAVAGEDIEASFVAAASLRRLGEMRRALALLNSLSVRLEASWGLHFERGMAHASLSETDLAVGALGKATQINPRSPVAWHALADELTLLGRETEAGTAMAHAESLPGGPTDPILAAVQGADELRKRIGLDLNDVAWLRLLADHAGRAGRWADCLLLLNGALAIAPDFMAGRFNRAIALHRLQRDQEALVDIERLVVAFPGAACVRALAAAVFMQAGQVDRASADFEVATALDPQNASLWQGFGHALRALGQLSKAVEAYRRAIDADASFTEAWWSLANLKTWKFAATDMEQMAGTLEKVDLATRSEAFLRFALGKAADDRGDYAEAFDQFQGANALRRAEAPFDRVGHSAVVDRTIKTFSAPLFAARGLQGCTASDPIFIVGMPRSGSTLVEQILSAHSGIEGLSELADLTHIVRQLALHGDYPQCVAQIPSNRLRELGESYLARIHPRRRSRTPMFVDKFPGNYLHAGLIRLILPSAKIIDVRRNAFACCFSLFTQNFAQGQNYSYNLGDLGSVYSDYVRLMSHFHEVMPGAVLRLSYEKLVDNLEGEAERLFEFLGLALEPACMEFFNSDRAVATPSSEQVRRPIYRDALERWRHYRQWLTPLRDALGE